MDQAPAFEELTLSLNQDLEIIDICDEWCSIIGYRPDELINKKIDIFISRKNSLDESNISSSLKKGREIEVISKGGASYYFFVNLNKSARGYLLTGRDITTLRRSEHRLNLLESHAKAGFWERTKDGKTYWSDQIYRLFDLPPIPIDDAFDKLLYDCFVGNGLDLINEHLERLFRQGGSYDLELEILTPKGVKKWLRTIGYAVEHNGQYVRIQGFIQDVTSYRENLLRLFESQETLQFTLSANEMGAWKLNYKTGELLWDKNMPKVFGISPDDVPKSLDEFYDRVLHPDDHQRIKNELASGLDKNGGILNTWFRILIDGKVRYIACRAGYSRSMGDLYYMGTNWDITKEKEAEEIIKLQEAKIISASRLSSLGEMAGGIAHEINNPLSVILARAGMLKRRSLKGDISQEELIDGLQKVEETCNRIVSIINGLRTISRDGHKDPMEKVEIQKCIHETVSLVAEKLKNNNVQLHLDLPKDPTYVYGRIVQLEQVLMNVLHNSYDAIADLPLKEIAVTLIETTDKVELRVRDSGNGVPDDLVEKIFMPFFTTKEIGKGTGIGLSISKSIIEEHGGEFLFKRTSPTDWYFSIILPRLS